MSETNKLNRKELLALWEKAFDAYETAKESSGKHLSPRAWDILHIMRLKFGCILYELRTTNEPNKKRLVIDNINENKIQPIVGHTYLCICEHWFTKEHKEIILRKIARDDDCDWWLDDANSELSYAWNVIEILYEISNRKTKKHT